MTPKDKVESVSETLDKLRETGTGALIGYLPIGFPNLSQSIEAAITLAESGISAIEFGIPYSDPVMDGPIIQRAAQASLDAGFKLKQVFEAVSAVKQATEIPVLLMSYWNPILQFGVERFCEQLASVGGSGIITPDLIPDDAAAWIAASNNSGLDRIFLAAPSSTAQRLAMITKQSRGFVYAVSTMGTTGVRSELDQAARGLVVRLREAGAERICVGLGISTKEQVREVLNYADGAIVGSALVAALEADGVSGLRERAMSLVDGIRLG